MNEVTTMDLVGMTFGKLLVTSKSSSRLDNGEILWNVKCTCGTSRQYSTSKLKHRVSCGKCTGTTVSISDTRKKAKGRIGRKTFGKLKLDEQLKIIQSYCFGNTVVELADKHNIDRISCRDGIKAFRGRLNSMYELNYMASIETTKLPQETIDKALATTFIEDKLIDKLSKVDTEDLTVPEQLYCYLFVKTGSNEIAIKESGFDEALDTKSSIKRQLLGMYLREKPNLKQYIEVLKTERLNDVKAEKKIVQYELIEQVEQLKEAVSHTGKQSERSNLLRAIELLGRTVGAFEDRVRVTEVNAADALDELLDMAKKAADSDVTLLPSGSPVDETWEVQEDE